MKEANARNEAYRAEYEEKKNQFELILQSQEEIFIYDPETGFFNYIKDDKYEEQGTCITLKFTDTIKHIKEQIRGAMAIPEGTSFELIEV